MKIQEKFDLGGRVAVVTGGAGLLGAEFCKTLAEGGASVAVVDLNAAAAQKLAAALCGDGYRAKGYGVDITRRDDVRGLADSVVKEFGRLDILVNSAALDPKFDAAASEKGIAPGSFEDYPVEQWNAAVNVNLTGLFLITQACVKPMLDQGKKGSIINICSTYGLNGPDQRIYIREGKRVAYKPVYYTVTKAG
ncbi:MAG TPA: SDR family NAD(P)-dependent oxidoreductase, partial [Anaerolineales bacterium]|nr:SDR family NAD(P)-dependent oxidoreductase [Anaerolineales bacterium]